jgi:hypothetical protein
MKPIRSWIMVFATGVPAVIACASTRGVNDGFASSSSGGGNGSSGGFGSYGYDGNVSSPDAPSSSPCRAGPYSGTFKGKYSSHLIIGIPLKVTGNVDMVLDQEGDAGTQCTLNGEFTNCSNVFDITGGTVTGVANGPDDGGMGGYPYFCVLSGTLDCPNKKLVDGWIDCIYCTGKLDPTGTACAKLGVLPGQGGGFAGPVTADYDTSTFSFVNGTWNGAEALAGVDAGTTTWMGKPVSSYLSDAGYGILKYGGEGDWAAAHK